jgi:hypothetical protein
MISAPNKEDAGVTCSAEIMTQAPVAGNRWKFSPIRYDAGGCFRPFFAGLLPDATARGNVLTG